MESKPLKIIRGRKRLTKVALCHEQPAKWPDFLKRDYYIIHRHIHNNTDTEGFKSLREMPNVLNAGVDINYYKPVTFDELLNNNRNLKGLE